MELDKFHLPMELEGPKTKKRGRPRKEMQIPPNAESSIMAQTRSQNKNGRNISAIDTLFSQSYVTTSPKKLNQKVIYLHYPFFINWAKHSLTLAEQRRKYISYQTQGNRGKLDDLFISTLLFHNNF